MNQIFSSWGVSEGCGCTIFIMTAGTREKVVPIYARKPDAYRSVIATTAQCKSPKLPPGVTEDLGFIA